MNSTSILVSSLTERNSFNGDHTLPNMNTGVTAEDRVNADNNEMVGITIEDTWLPHSLK